MQKTGRMDSTVGKNPSERTVAHRNYRRSKRSRADEAASGRTACHFLNRVFRPLPAFRIHSQFNKKNYDCLYASAKNYAGLSGSHFDYRKSAMDFMGLFRYFESLLPPNQHLLTVEEEGKLSFRLWFGTDFLTREVFFIPINILNKTEGRFRDILLAFFQLFRQAHGFPAKEDMCDYDMTVNYFVDFHDTDDDPDRSEYMEAYGTGYIHDTFALIYRKPGRSVEELEQLIKNCPVQNESENRLLGSIRTGINLILTGKSVFDYACQPANPDDIYFDPDDEYVIEAERMLRFVYSGNDAVSESYLELLQIECGDSANEYFPRNSLLLTPETDRLLEVDFVECFFTWLMEFIENLYNYETD